jgi:hypothetical protein
MSHEKTQYVSLAELENDRDPIEGLHPFEIDLNVLVKVNHQLTIDAIDKLEREETAETRNNFKDRDFAESLVRDHEVFCDDLRLAAIQLAAVGLVTKFQQWIAKFAKQHGGRPKKARKASRNRSSLCIRLEELNESLGDGPVPVDV